MLSFDDHCANQENQNFVIFRLNMVLSFNKLLQPNFPHKSVLSLSNAIVGASVLSMGYCFQQVIISILITKKNNILSFFYISVGLF